MLPLTHLFTQLCRNPSDGMLLAGLRALCGRHAPKLRMYYARDDATCREALTGLLARTSTHVEGLVPLAEAQVRIRHRLDEGAPIDAQLLVALAKDPLCLLILSESLNEHVALERAYIGVRRTCLHGACIPAGVQPLMAALALQAWLNEYVWEETPEETAQVAALPEAIDAAVVHGDLMEAALPLLRWAMYRPLSALAAADWLIARPFAAIPPVLRALWQRTLRAPREEAALRAALPAFGEITDATSRAVRSQYEENPYPRWLRLSLRRKSVLERHQAYDPSFAWPPTFLHPLQILVAGCGTGQHALAVASENPDAEVLAIDLSASSLAYAQRMARELGIGNARFMQMDLLHLPEWGRQFHHIECVGVLHHMRDQLAAWKSVTAALHPGGTLSLAVYSKVAWLPLTCLIARIAREGVPPTAAAMRGFRARLLREPHSLALLGRCRGGLRSLSMVRDMLFHVHRHYYTLTELEQQATACGLRLLGYQVPRSTQSPPPPQAMLGQRIAVPAGPPTFAQWRALELTYAGSGRMFSCTFQRTGSGDSPPQLESQTPGVQEL